jgi:hypothetical protein
MDGGTAYVDGDEGTWKANKNGTLTITLSGERQKFGWEKDGYRLTLKTGMRRAAISIRFPLLPTNRPNRSPADGATNWAKRCSYSTATEPACISRARPARRTS